MKIKFLSLDTPNLNGRLYSKSIIENAIKNTQPKIEKNMFFLTYKAPESSDINIMGIAGIVKQLYVENNELMADIEFINTPNSLHAEIAVREGKLHVSIAGIGSIKTINEISYIQDDYELSCLFLTDDPA